MYVKILWHLLQSKSEVYAANIYVREKKQDLVMASKMMVNFVDYKVCDSEMNFFKLVLIVCHVILLTNTKGVM